MNSLLQSLYMTPGSPGARWCGHRGIWGRERGGEGTAATPVALQSDGGGGKEEGVEGRCISVAIRLFLFCPFAYPRAAEFRSSLYAYRFNAAASMPDMNIPYQLQRLFARLQIGERPYCETKDLTHSFNWGVRGRSRVAGEGPTAGHWDPGDSDHTKITGFQRHSKA